MSPSPRLVAALALLAALGVLPALLGDGAAAVVFAAAVGLVLATGLDVALAPTRRAVAVRASAPASVALGTEGALDLEVAVGDGAGARFEVVADLSPELDDVAPSALAVPARGAARLAVPLVPRRRGPASVRSVSLRWTGPLGLVRRQRDVTLDRPVVVVPDVAPVRQAAVRLAFAQASAGARRVRVSGDGSEFEALREHVAGMDPRALDWKASAKHLRLVGRETRAERDRPVVVALDTGRLMGEPVAGVPRVDHAVRAGLLLAYAALRTGDRVGLLGFDDRPRAWVAPTSGPGAFGRFLAAAGGLAYSTAEPNYALAVADLSARLRRRTLVVVLTDFADSTAAELLLDAMTPLARRHLLLFVALRDPVLLAIADAEPRTTADLHRAVVAADLVRDREVVLRRLRRAGAHVVDTTPDRLSSELLDRYLWIHRRELVG